MDFETKIRKGNGITSDYVVYVIDDGEELKIGEISKDRSGTHVMSGSISVGKTAPKGFYSTATKELGGTYCGGNRHWSRTRAQAVESLLNTFTRRINNK